MRRALRGALAVCAVVATVALVGCATLPAPARSVESLLELRARNSTDAAAYERYLESTTVAGALAQDAATRKSSAVPGWATPTVRSSSETSAVVVITWKADMAHKNWPASTDFVLKRTGGRWMVVDAQAASTVATNAR